MNKDVMRKAFASGGNMVRLSPVANVPFESFFVLFKDVPNMTQEAFVEFVQHCHLHGYEEFFRDFPWDECSTG